MKNKSWNGLVDRANWPAGEWDNEPDKEQWQDEITGMPCLIVRSEVGHLCGYVGVDSEHPGYQKEYMEVGRDLNCHGGLTYSDGCIGWICHEIEEGDAHPVWWFGFDCMHYCDASPSLFSSKQDWEGGATYRDFGYVKKECAYLAKQLKEWADDR